MTSKYTYRHDELDPQWSADKDGMNVARLGVVRHGQQDQYRYPSGEVTHRALVPDDNTGGYTPGPLRRGPWNFGEAQTFNVLAREHANAHGGQLPLFLQHHVAAHETVDSLFAARGHQQAAMTMVGMAQNWNRQQFGRDLVPSDNVSPHSAKLVGHLKERGVVGADAEDTPSNDYGFDDPQAAAIPVSRARSLYDRDVPEDEVRRGRMTIRSIVGRRRAATQGQQGTLF